MFVVVAVFEVIKVILAHYRKLEKRAKYKENQSVILLLRDS